MRKGCDFLVNFTMNKTLLIRAEYSLERYEHKDETALNLIFSANQVFLKKKKIVGVWVPTI